MTQGCREGLYHAYKVLVSSCLLLCHCKPMLMKLEISLPQLVGLNFNALMWNDHLWTCGSDHWLLIFVENWHTCTHRAPLITPPGEQNVTACGLMSQTTYKV